SYTDKNLAVWTYQYDAVGNRTSETSPAVVVSQADASGNLVNVTRSVVTLNEYDAFGNVTRRIEDLGTATARATEYVYDNRGLQVLTRFPDAGVMGADGQVHASGVQPTVEVTYNALGLAVAQKDVLGYYSFKTYDAAGRVIHDIDAEGYVTQYDYNVFGQQTRLLRYAAPVSISGNTAPGLSDVAALVVASPNQDRLLLTHYDNAGRKMGVVQVFNRMDIWNPGSYFQAYGKTTDYVYNIYGDLVSERLTTDTEGWSLDESYLQAQNGEAETRYFYDNAGRQTHKIDADGFVTAWEYSVNGELIRETQYAVAGDGAPQDDGEWNNGGWSRSSAEPEFDPQFAGHNRVTEWTYDALGRKISERRSQGNPDDGMFVESLTEYDASGRATAVTVQGEQTRTYYDAMGRVTAVRESERDVLNGNSDIQLGSTGVNL
ncbi:MAG: hypothetical protein ACRER5_09405, partial [Pseudomonas sp.]